MWASRDVGAWRIEVWWKEPHLNEAGLWSGERDYFDGHLLDCYIDLGLVLQPGQCVEIEDIKLVRKRKPIANAKGGAVMANDVRRANVDWIIRTDPDGTVHDYDAHLAVLMDIRDHLRTLNGLLQCPNFLGFPNDLRRIRLAVEKQSRRRKATRK